MAEDNGFE